MRVESLLLLGAILGYLLSFVFYLVKFETVNERVPSWGPRAALAALILHAGYFLFLTIQTGRCPITTLPEMLSLFAFLIVLFALIAEKRYKAGYLALFSLPMAVFGSVVSAYLLKSQQNLAEEASVWIRLHTGFILIGFAGLVISVAGALMYLMQSYQLKSKHPGLTFLKLPPLGRLDRIHFVSLGWGVLFYSFGLLAGLFSAESVQDLAAVIQDPKVVLSILGCLMFWMILLLRARQIRRGHKIAFGTVLVFLLLLATFSGGNYGLSAFHGAA